MSEAQEAAPPASDTAPDTAGAPPDASRGAGIPAATELAGIQRHVVRTLMTSQALGGIGMSAGVSVAALLARDVSGHEALAGWAATSQMIGAAGATVLIARLMATRGRRVGLTVGYAIGVLGAAVCVFAGTIGVFAVLLAGTTLLGAGQACNNQTRYAATDLAAPGHQARTMSLVVWTATIGSVLGPNLVGPGAAVAGWFGLPSKTGPFLFGVAAMGLAGAVLAVRLRPDPLLLARRLRATTDGPPAPHPTARQGWAITAGYPVVRAAAIALALNHAVMVAVMIMTPLHMDHGGAELQVIGLVISGHILGMFAFAPLVGWTVDRFGATPILIGAVSVHLVSLALAGSSHAGASGQLAVGLFLLGLAWSAGMISASTLITTHTPTVHRPAVQGLTDSATALTSAAAGIVSGAVMAGPGFSVLNVFAAMLTLGVLWAAMRTWRPAADARAGGR